MIISPFITIPLEAVVIAYCGTHALTPNGCLVERLPDSEEPHISVNFDIWKNKKFNDGVSGNLIEIEHGGSMYPNHGYGGEANTELIKISSYSTDSMQAIINRDFALMAISRELSTNSVSFGGADFIGLAQITYRGMPVGINSPFDGYKAIANMSIGLRENSLCPQ